MKASFRLILILLALAAPVAEARQSIQTAFSPGIEAITLVENTINGAKDSIHLAAYSFTSTRVTNALLAAYERGVDVKIIVDKTGTKTEEGHS